VELSDNLAVYGKDFFADIAAGSRSSADKVAGLIVDIFSPRSVVDIGGGGGYWAAAFLALGVPKVLCIDGPWVPDVARVVPPDCFREQDLSQSQAIGDGFDLAVCLEAAEHLPEHVAPTLVAALAETAPVIIFSAAVPGQGGDGHINEQLQSYWAKLFAAEGYICFSDIRSRIWNDATIEPWYRQNILCFIRAFNADRWRSLLAEEIAPDDPRIDVAHPLFLSRHKAAIDNLERYLIRLEHENTDLRRTIDQTRTELAEAANRLKLLEESRLGRLQKMWHRATRP